MERKEHGGTLNRPQPGRGHYFRAASHGNVKQREERRKEAEEEEAEEALDGLENDARCRTRVSVFRFCCWRDPASRSIIIIISSSIVACHS